MDKRGQTGVETMIAVAIVLFILLMISLMLVMNEQQKTVIKRTWDLDVECDRISNLLSAVHAGGHGMSITTFVRDYNLVILASERGMEVQSEDDYGSCNFPMNNVEDANGLGTFTIPEHSTLYIQNTAGKVVMSVV